MKRPSEMTDEELRALPIGHDWIVEEPLTAEDRAGGMIGRVKQRVERRAQRVSWHAPDDILCWHDARTGCSYMFGQFLDGSWFKQTAGLTIQSISTPDDAI